jgi:hypothetical protein
VLKFRFGESQSAQRIELPFDVLLQAGERVLWRVAADEAVLRLIPGIGVHGELLRRAHGVCNVFVTLDRNLV